MEWLLDIGRKASKFVLLYALISSFITYAYVAAGHPELVKSPVFMSTAWFSEVLKSSLSKLNLTNATAPQASTALSVAVGVALFTFATKLITGFVDIVMALTSLIPPMYSWLVPPFMFLASFIQFCVNLYWLKKLSEMVGNVVTSFVRVLIGR